MKDKCLFGMVYSNEQLGGALEVKVALRAFSDRQNNGKRML
jgi:hypothetical protein